MTLANYLSDIRSADTYSRIAGIDLTALRGRNTRRTLSDFSPDKAPS